MRDSTIMDRRHLPVGIRDSAIRGDNNKLRKTIGEAIKELTLAKNLNLASLRCVIAAGMITSSLGLHEVNHVQAPAGLPDLAGHVEKEYFEDMPGLPFFFIPGVRCGPINARLKDVDAIDFMRGEETEVFGALGNSEAGKSLLYVHLGSHTKFIQIDKSSRIVAGASTLGGELLHGLQTQTILRSSLPEAPLATISTDSFKRGWENSRTAGLTRSLFHVRILDLCSDLSKEDLQSYFLGVILSQEFLCLARFFKEARFDQAVLSGLPNNQMAWKQGLEHMGLPVRSLTAKETEQAFLRGLLAIFTISQRL
jgi:2-dehydro-3-deoxygalactonokinase